MKRFKQFLTEASVLSKDTYINGDSLPLNPNPNKAEELVGEILKLETDLGFIEDDVGNSKYQRITKDAFEEFVKKGKAHKIPLDGVDHVDPAWTLYTRQSDNKYALVITSNSKNSIENAFSGGPSGRSPGLSGNEGELFWEYISWLGATNKPNLNTEITYSKTPDDIGSISVEKLNTRLREDAKYIDGIYTWTQTLIKELGKGNPDHIYARWDKKEIDDYYSFMSESATKWVKPDQKENVADALWVWGNTDFVKTYGSAEEGTLNFVETGSSGVIEVWEGIPGHGGTLVSTMLQVSLKKGRAVAQGGGTTDTLKGMGVYSASFKKQLVQRAKSPEKVTDFEDLVHMEEGIVDFIKKGIDKLKNVFSKMFGYLDRLVNGIKTEWEKKGRRMALKLAKRAGIDKSMLGEGVDVGWGEVDENQVSRDFDSFLKRLQGLEKEYTFKFVQDGIVEPDSNWFGKNVLSGNKQREHLQQIILNQVAMWTMGNYASKVQDADTDVIITEMAELIWDIKIGNSKLPVIQLYGDQRWEVLDRGSSKGNITEIGTELENAKNDQKDFYPMIAQMYASKKKGDVWNVCHLYTVKSMGTVNGKFKPVYFKIVLRGDGFSTKIPTENKYYTWDGDKTFSEYKGH